MLQTFVRKFHGSFSRSVSEKMVRVLNVAEKNDAAKSLSDVLSQGRFSKREGFSKFNKIYEFDYRLMNQQVKMSMTSVSGHLLGLEFIGLFKKWNTCNPVDLFSVPVEKYCPEQFKDIKRTLEREIKTCQTLIIWTDCDREGENIGYEVIEVCQAVKPNIKVYRAKFSEITPHAVSRAINNLGPPDPRINDAVNVRQELDLRIGAAFTRFQTLRLKKIFPAALGEQLISYGSCQFPTLGFVVERYKQVMNFIPEPFWKIRVTHTHDGVKADFSWKRNRLFDYLACQVLFDQCTESPVATVVDVRSKSKSKWRPAALDTVELEKIASRKLKVNAKETMKIAEKLYTQGLISYPRTETNMFPKEMDLVSLVQEQTRDPNWGEFAQQVLENGPHPRNGSKTDNAHPPIHPLKYTASLQGNEQKIYEFIVRHFLACVSQDAQGHETVVEIDIAQERFHAQGLMILARNYLDVYIYEKWNAKEIPLYSQGDQFEPNAIEIVAGETSAPPLLSEADLIALMEKHGIGTDATHADHIETVKSRMYVGLRPDGKFVPGELGMGLVEGYDNMGYEMSKPNLRAELEADLKLICDGRKFKDEVLQVQVQKYKEVFVEACRQAQKLDEALSVYLGEAQTAPDYEEMSVAAPSIVMKCPRCGQPMTLRTKKDGRSFYIGCSSYPDCKASIWLPETVLQASITDEVCQNCNPGPVMRLRLKFKPGSVPVTVSTDYVGCVAGCDEMLTEVLGIRPLAAASSQASRPNMPGAAQRTPTAGGNNRQTGTSSNNSHANSSRGGSGGVRTGSTGSSNYSRSVHTASPSLGATNNCAGNTNNNYNNSYSNSNNYNSSNYNSSNNTPGSNRMVVNNRDAQASVRPFFNNSFTSGPLRPAGPRPHTPAHRSPLASVHGANNSYGNTGQGRGRAPFGSAGVSGSGGDGDAGDRDRAIVCNCGNDAIQLTVRKEGPNTGRQFYKCSGQNGSNCNFFMWADEGDGGQRSSTSSSSDSPWRANERGHQTPRQQTPARNYNNSPGGVGNNAAEDEVSCRCGLPAKFLTVQKVGPNTGRQFYACSKPREQSCNFFQWADEGDGNSSFRGPGSGSSGGGLGPFQPRPGGGGEGGGGSGAKRKRPPPGGGGDGPKPRKPPTCGYCGQPGHRKPKCPERSGDF
ncbi:DNA topoisomerase 3-alpha [Aplysia californica]|uniref:DNA topoisomerase n=1 Tax=Aplysia californica TaxID=6500 RepID=A0ABM0JPS9_APLCA|nr:DNA topoisomerase 3-alpha [Aplysia californica]